MAVDPSFRWLDRVILDLHFDVCCFQRDKDPGLWRPGPIGVTGADGSLEYRGPDAEDVVGLMDEIVSWLDNGDLEVSVFIRAAMAHLNVISVHPFRDGNGRIARIIQSLVLARGDWPPPTSSRSRSTSVATPRITTRPSAKPRAGVTSHSAMPWGGSHSASTPISPRRVVASHRWNRLPSAGNSWKLWPRVAAGPTA